MHAGQETSDRARGLLLAEQLATRMSHDLSGPLSGLVAALGETSADAEALPLAVEAATVLRQRLALLRAAWGAPVGLAADGLRDLFAGLPRANRLRLDLAGPVATAALEPLRARLLLNALLLAAEGLPRGGTVMLEGDPEATVVLGIDGNGAAWPAGLAAMLADAEAAWRGIAEAGRHARQQAALIALFARQAGARVSVLLGRGPEAAAPNASDLGAVGR